MSAENQPSLICVNDVCVVKTPSGRETKGDDTKHDETKRENTVDFTVRGRGRGRGGRGRGSGRRGKARNRHVSPPCEKSDDESSTHSGQSDHSTERKEKEVAFDSHPECCGTTQACSQGSQMAQVSQANPGCPCKPYCQCDYGSACKPWPLRYIESRDQNHEERVTILSQLVESHLELCRAFNTTFDEVESDESEDESSSDESDDDECSDC